jgi:hypothetical protein
LLPQLVPPQLPLQPQEPLQELPQELLLVQQPEPPVEQQLQVQARVAQVPVAHQAVAVLAPHRALRVDHLRVPVQTPTPVEMAVAVEFKPSMLSTMNTMSTASHGVTTSNFGPTQFTRCSTKFLSAQLLRLLR